MPPLFNWTMDWAIPLTFSFAELQNDFDHSTPGCEAPQGLLRLSQGGRWVAELLHWISNCCYGKQVEHFMDHVLATRLRIHRQPLAVPKDTCALHRPVTHHTVLVSCNMLVTIMRHSHWTWQTLLSSPWSFPGHNPHIDWSTGTMWDWSNHSDAVCFWSAFVQFSRVPMNYINWKKVFNSTWATLPPHHPYACAIDPLSGLAVPVFPHRPWILWRWKTRPSAPSSTNGAPNDIPVRTSAPSHFFCLWTLTRCNHFLWTWPQKYFSFCFH